jgi:two-component system phosphate regulon response regulator PhoB
MHSPQPPQMLANELPLLEDYVLIVDDDRMFRQLLCHTLTTDGFNCIAASTAEEALRLFRHSRPRLIVLDLIMALATGGELFKTLESDMTTASVQVIAMSATASSIIRPDALALDAQFVLSKTRFSMLEFRRLVKRIMSSPPRASAA